MSDDKDQLFERYAKPFSLESGRWPGTCGICGRMSLIGRRGLCGICLAKVLRVERERKEGEG